MNKENIFGQAKWIGVDPKINTPYIRQDFKINKKGKTIINICGLGFFYLYINGIKVGNDIFAPARSDYNERNIEIDNKPFDEKMRHRIYVIQYDITDYVKEGNNKLAVALGPGFYDNLAWSYDHNVKYGNVRLIFKIENSYENEKEIILSNKDAQYKNSPIVESNIFRGETIDFTSVTNIDDFAVCPTDDWKSVIELEDLETDYYIQNCPNDAIMKVIEPKLIKTFGELKVFDIGENTTGWVVVKCRGNYGDVIDIHYSEELNMSKAPDKNFGYKQYTKIILDGKARIVKPSFVWYGFRYFSIKGNCEVDKVEVIYSNISKNSSFDCDNKTINWIYDAFIRTQLSNMHAGVPSDCPHIERRGYTGDGQLCARASMMFLSSKEFYYKWIDDILDCQDLETGHVQYTAPYQRCGGGPGGWGCAIITVPYEYYLRYDDKSVLEKAYPQMLLYLKYLDVHSEDNLVVSDRKGSWCLGDWCAPNGVKLKESFVNTYFHIKSLILIEKIENILGYDNSDKDNIRRKEIIKAFIDAFYDEESGSFHNGEQGADAFAIDIGLGNEKTLKNLVIKYKNLGEYDTGIFGTEILTRVLLERGFEELVFSLITSTHDVSFETIRKAGATTFWEYWPGEEERSHSHPMFGGFSHFIISYILGIRNANGKAGYKEVIINPRMVNTVKRAGGSFMTECGMIKMRYANLTKKSFYITIPHGMKAMFKYADKKQMLNEGENTIIL